MFRAKNDNMEEDEAKEMYAHFGLAYYIANCLEHSIANALCFLEVFPSIRSCNSQIEWNALIDKHYDESFEKTFGQLKKKLEPHKQSFPSLVAVMPDLEKCLTERNYLAHHFYRDNELHPFTPNGREKMIQRLETARELFHTTDRKLGAAIEPLMRKYGITDELLEKTYNEMLSEAEQATI